MDPLGTKTVSARIPESGVVDALLETGADAEGASKHYPAFSRGTRPGTPGRVGPLYGARDSRTYL